MSLTIKIINVTGAIIKQSVCAVLKMNTVAILVCWSVVLLNVSQKIVKIMFLFQLFQRLFHVRTFISPANMCYLVVLFEAQLQFQVQTVFILSIFYRFILCESSDIYMSLDSSHDDSAAELIEEQNKKKRDLLKEIDFAKLVERTC